MFPKGNIEPTAIPVDKKELFDSIGPPTLAQADYGQVLALDMQKWLLDVNRYIQPQEKEYFFFFF